MTIQTEETKKDHKGLWKTVGTIGAITLLMIAVFVISRATMPAASSIATTTTESEATCAATEAPTAAPETPITTALWTSATCSSLSEQMGIPLEAKIEGNGFTYCKYIGPIVQISLPNFTIADVDRGQVEVWVNSDQTVTFESGDLTLRQWDGKTETACAHLVDFTNWAAKQPIPFTPVARNFTCPVN